ncbi:partial Tol-Pal system protein TolB, partial [Anaerolineae bacterium]
MNLHRLIPLGAWVAVAFFLWHQPTSQAQTTPPNSPIIQLTNNRALDIRPAWSPDNRLIAFQSNRDSETYHIYVMNADGSDQRALTKGATDNRHPVWMPDGKSILFDSEEKDEQEEIWMVNVADGSLKQIT